MIQTLSTLSKKSSSDNIKINNDDNHEYDKEGDVYSRIYKDPSSTKPSDPPPTTLNAFADLQNEDHCVVRVMIVITTETN